MEIFSIQDMWEEREESRRKCANTNLRWPRSATPNISETSNSNYKHQIQITNIKFKFVTSNLNSSHQIQIHHIKFKFITSNSNSPHQIQIHHIKFKFMTSNSNS